MKCYLGKEIKFCIFEFSGTVRCCVVMWCGAVWYHWLWWTNYSWVREWRWRSLQLRTPVGACSLVRPQHRPHYPPPTLFFNLNKGGREFDSRVPSQARCPGIVLILTTAPHLPISLISASAEVIHQKLVKKVTLPTTTKTKQSTNQIVGNKPLACFI